MRSFSVGLATLAEAVADQLLFKFVEELHVAKNKLIQLHLSACAVVAL